MIDSPKFRFIAALEQKILTEQDPDKAVELAELFALVMLAEMPDRYEATEIEQHVISLFQEVKLDVVAQKCNQTLHVITTPYATGGHTRLMENLAAAEEVSPCLLVTGEYTEQALTRARKVFDECLFVNLAALASERICGLLQVMAEFDRVVLHIHQHDISSVVACWLAKKYGSKIFFVNHADHTFSYGNSVADVWFQISGYGATVDCLRKLKSEISFIGIPAGGRVDFEQKNSRNHVPKVMCTAGSSYKFNPALNDSKLLILIDRLLQRYDSACFYVVGVRPWLDYWWWPLKIKYRKRISLVSSLPFSQYVSMMSSVDLYVDSYPLPGGTAFSQQLAQGKRCIGLFTGYEGYSPAEQLKHATVAEVMTALDNPFNEEEQQEILEQTILVNSQEAVAERYRAALSGKLLPLNKKDMGLIDVPNIRFNQSVRLSIKYDIFFLRRLLRVDKSLFVRFFLASPLGGAIVYFVKFLVKVFGILMSGVRK